MELKLRELDVETWVASRPTVVLMNRAVVRRFPVPDHLTPEFRGRLGDGPTQFLLATREDFDRIGLVLSHSDLNRFERGKPILLTAGRVAHREPLKRGRRPKDKIETAVQDALASQIFVVTERLGAWLQGRDGRRLSLTVPELRDRVLTMLAEEAWIDDPNTANADTAERRLAFFRTQIDAGSRLVSHRYPWAKRPDDLSKVARHVVEASVRQMNREEIDAAIEEEVAIIRCMLQCLRQATTLVLTEHAMSAHVREHETMSRHQQAVLAGAIGERLALHRAVRAAIDGDFNPADLFRGLLSYRGMLEVARVLGRYGRGHNVRLENVYAQELRRLIGMRDAVTAEQCQDPREWTQETAAVWELTTAAYEAFPRSEWILVLDRAILAEEGVRLTA